METIISRKGCPAEVAKESGIFPDSICSADSQIDNFDIINIEVGSYKESFQEATRVAKERNGQVYTMVDGEGITIHYEKGTHWVNRIGVCVLIPI